MAWITLRYFSEVLGMQRELYAIVPQKNKAGEIGLSDNGTDLRGKNDCCRTSGKSATHDDNVGVKFSLAHLYPPYCLKAKGQYLQIIYHFRPQTRTHAPHILFL